MTYPPRCTLLTALFALLITAPLPAQQRWEPANKGLDAGLVREFGFSARGDVYAAGEDGIYRLVGGDHWEMLHRDLRAYSFQTAPDGTMLIISRSPSGFALLRSTDNGDNWELSNDGAQTRPSIASDGTLYLPSTKGLLRSLDMGKSWQMLSAPVAGPHSSSTMGAVAIEKIGTVIYTPGDSTTWISSNRGDSWTLTGSSLPYYYTPSVAILPDGRLIAFTSYSDVHVSTDRGKSWTPGDSLMIWRGGLRLPNGDLVYYYADNTLPLGDAGLFRSYDAGRTWQRLDTGRLQALSVAPDGTIWKSAIPDCYRSTDGGTSWQQITTGMDAIRPSTPVMDAAGNLYLTRVERIIEESDITQPTSSYALFRSSDNGSNWYKVGGGLKQEIQIDDDGRIYAARAVTWATTFGPELIVSRDGGRTWQDLYAAPLYQMQVQRNGTITALATGDRGIYELVISHDGGSSWNRRPSPRGMRQVHRTGQGVIMAHMMVWGVPDSAYGVYRSADDGITWEPVFTGTEQNEFVIASDNTGTIYLAGNPNRPGPARGVPALYRSIDNGITFQKTLDSVNVWRLAPMAHGTIVVSRFDDAGRLSIITSTDRGATWSPAPSLPGANGRLLTDGSAGAIYFAEYVGENLRLHRSGDNGRTWELFENGLPPAGIYGILDMPYRPMFVATTRGIFRMNAPSAAPLVVAANALSFDIMPNPIDGNGRIALTLPSRQHVRVTLHDMLGRTISVLANGERESGRSTIALETDGLAAGSYILRMSSGEQTISRVLFVR